MSWVLCGFIGYPPLLTRGAGATCATPFLTSWRACSRSRSPFARWWWVRTSARYPKDSATSCGRRRYTAVVCSTLSDARIAPSRAQTATREKRSHALQRTTCQRSGDGGLDATLRRGTQLDATPQKKPHWQMRSGNEIDTA